MPKYKIADVVFQADLLYEYTKKLCSAYEYGGDEPSEFSVTVTADDVAAEKALAPDFKDEYLENLVILRRLCDYVLDKKQGMIFHSSAIAVDGQAYLFTAPSGTGKSTHAHLWRQLLGERAVMVNDDKPIVRLIDGKFFVYGTPWNGKHNIGSNVSYPVKAVCLLRQAKENAIYKCSPAKTLMTILNQTVRPTDERKMDKLLTLAEKFIEKTAAYLLECNVSKQAAELSFNTMSKGNENEN